MKKTKTLNKNVAKNVAISLLLVAAMLFGAATIPAPTFAAPGPVEEPYYGDVYATTNATYTAPAETPEEFAKLHPIMELAPGISWGAWNSKKQYTLENIEDAAKILDAVRANAVCCAYATPAQIPTDYDIMIALSDGSINQKVYISTDRVSMILNDEYRLEYALTGWASAYIEKIYRPYTETHIQTVLTPNPDATSMVAGGAYASITDSQELEIWNLVYDNAVFYSNEIELVPEDIDLDLTYCYPEWMMEELGIDFDTNKVMVFKAKTIGGSDENRPVSYHLTYQLPVEVVDQIKYILDKAMDMDEICLSDSVKADIKEFAQMYPRALDMRGLSIEDVENFIYNDDLSTATEIILALQLNGCEADQYLRNALAATTYEEMKMWLAREIVDVCEDDVIYKDYTSYLINEVKTSYTHSTTVENQAIVAMYTATWIKTLDAEAFYSSSKR